MYLDEYSTDRKVDYDTPPGAPVLSETLKAGILFSLLLPFIIVIKILKLIFNIVNFVFRLR